MVPKHVAVFIVSDAVRHSLHLGHRLLLAHGDLGHLSGQTGLWLLRLGELLGRLLELGCQLQVVDYLVLRLVRGEPAGLGGPCAASRGFYISLLVFLLTERLLLFTLSLSGVDTLARLLLLNNTCLHDSHLLGYPLSILIASQVDLSLVSDVVLAGKALLFLLEIALRLRLPATVRIIILLFLSVRLMCICLEINDLLLDGAPPLR